MSRSRAPYTVTVEGPVAAANGVAWYDARCRVPTDHHLVFSNYVVRMGVVPGSPLANWLQRRIPALQAICLADKVHVPSNVRISTHLLRHEAVHVWQYLIRCRGSWLRYLIGYFYLLARFGYTNHPWEREARAVTNPTYDRSIA